MRNTVKLFAILRERAGVGELPVHLPQGATVADLLEFLQEERPGLLGDVPSIMVAVNMEYVSHSYSLHEGDEVALIPPVSGGAP